MTEITPRKTVVEARILPKLSFYAKMDGIGEALLEKMDTDQWERSPFSLEIVDPENREKLVLEHRRFVCELDGPASRQKDAARTGFALVKLALDECSLLEVVRLGIRQWFAIELRGNTEERLIKKLRQAYLHADTLAEANGMQSKDFALVLEMETPSDQRCSARLSLGAMTKSQWIRHAPYGAQPGRSPNQLGTNGVQQIIDELPDDFIFVDIDKRISAVDPKSHIPIADCETFVASVNDDMKTLAQQIIRDIKESQP